MEESPIKAVLKASQEGCPFCCLVANLLGPDSRERMTRSSWIRIFFDRVDQNQGKVITGTQHDTGLAVRWLRVMLCSTLSPLRMAESDVDFILHIAADDGIYDTS